MGYIAIKHAFIYPLSVNYIPDDNNYAIHPLPLSPLISPALFSHPLLSLPSPSSLPLLPPSGAKTRDLLSSSHQLD